jgi:hypothetical protein
MVDLTDDPVQVKTEPGDDLPRKRKVVRFVTPANWTEPSAADAANGSTKEHCLNVVEQDSEEYKKVEEALRLSLHRGSTKLMYEENTPHPRGDLWPAAYIGKGCKTMPQCFEITKMVRVQNETSSLGHMVIRDSMITKVGIANLKEETVYHGTNPETAKKIGLEGFNRSFTITHRFGVGCYGDASSSSSC